MKKFKFLFLFGLKKRIRTKAFVISNIIVGIILLGLTLIPTIIALATSGEPQAVEIEDTIWIVDTTNNDVSAPLTDYINQVVENSGIVNNLVIEIKDESVVNDDFFTNLDINGMIVISDDVVGVKARIYNNNISATTLSILTLSATELNRIIHHQTNPDDIVNNSAVTEYTDPSLDSAVPMELISGLSSLLIIPLFMLITFGVQFIGADIIEEKSTKAIEVIIASVPPRTHFLSKISATLTFLILQLLLYLLYAVIGVLINGIISPAGSAGWGEILGPILSMVGPTLIVTLITTVVGILLYLVLAAFIASLAINQEDFQQIQTPIMMIIMVGYFASLMASSFQSDVIIRILAYIPFISPMIVPVAFLTGAITVWDVVISIVILIATTVLVIMFLSPAYRASILSYDQSKLIQRIKNSFKSAKALKQNKNNKLNK